MLFGAAKCSWGTLGTLLGVLRPLLGASWASWWPLGVLLEPLRSALETLLVPLGLGMLLGHCWGTLGALLARLGALLGRFGGYLGASWRHLGENIENYQLPSVFWSHFGTQNGGRKHQKSHEKSNALFTTRF